MLTEMAGLGRAHDVRRGHRSGRRPSIDEINAALDKIEEAEVDGQVLKFTGNEYLRSLENGELAACVAWSGDILSLEPDCDIKFVIPDEGGMQWFDTMDRAKGAAPTGSPRPGG